MTPFFLKLHSTRCLTGCLPAGVAARQLHLADEQHVILSKSMNHTKHIYIYIATSTIAHENGGKSRRKEEHYRLEHKTSGMHTWCQTISRIGESGNVSFSTLSKVRSEITRYAIKLGLLVTQIDLLIIRIVQAMMTFELWINGNTHLSSDTLEQKRGREVSVISLAW